MSIIDPLKKEKQYATKSSEPKYFNSAGPADILGIYDVVLFLPKRINVLEIADIATKKGYKPVCNYIMEDGDTYITCCTVHDRKTPIFTISDDKIYLRTEFMNDIYGSDYYYMIDEITGKYETRSKSELHKEPTDDYYREILESHGLKGVIKSKSQTEIQLILDGNYDQIKNDIITELEGDEFRYNYEKNTIQDKGIWGMLRINHIKFNDREKTINYYTVFPIITEIIESKLNPDNSMEFKYLTDY